MGKRYLPRRCALGQKITSGLFIRQVSNEEHSKNHLIMIISLFRIIHTKKIAVLKKWKIKTSRYTLAITALKIRLQLIYIIFYLHIYAKYIFVLYIYCQNLKLRTHQPLEQFWHFHKGTQGHAYINRLQAKYGDVFSPFSSTKKPLRYGRAFAYLRYKHSSNAGP